MKNEVNLNYKLDWGLYPLLKLLSNYEFDNVLDVGSGSGEHKRFLELFGKKVYSVDILNKADYVGDFLEVEFDKQFDVVWCSHVLEHQRNVGLFLDKIFNVLKDDGVLAISVPIHPRERLVPGHITSWSIPLLCYNLILAGFNCKCAQICSIFELSLVVEKELAQHKELHTSSAHLVDHLSEYFPFPLQENGLAEIPLQATLNWESVTDYVLPKPLLPQNVVAKINITSKNLTHPDLVPKLTFG